MNIGIITTWFERGAAYVSRAYRDALEPHHRVFIFARGGPTQAEVGSTWNSKYVTWSRRVWLAGQTSIPWGQFRRWVDGNHLDIIIFNEQHDWFPVVKAVRELPVPLGTYVDYYTAETVPFFHLYDFLLCNTRRHYELFRNHKKAYYVPWGVDCRTFVGSGARATPSILTFFHSAGMSPDRKGTLLALKAFTRLCGDCRFVLHLQRSLADFPEIQDICCADGRIKVISQEVPAPGLYHLGDVYVYPTVLEGIGLTIAEALACGLPVITTDAPPMSEFVCHGDNGFLVKPAYYLGRSDGYYWAESCCDVEGVAVAMQYYLDNAAHIEEFKRRARASALERLDWSRNAVGLPQALADVARVGRSAEDLSEIEARAMKYARRWRLRCAVGRILARLGR